MPTQPDAEMTLVKQTTRSPWTYMWLVYQKKISLMV